ncbi:MAG: LacI family DNA-binding transcriptional regulator [Rhodobacteraceae bacterium]|nr:LacI family DNA-binding transcriptional regulator [Paracoccaceae bacterium]MCY4138010.1 LacI family DNA-binding transcriptional regulator [Paracoccaceae bacterium]
MKATRVTSADVAVLAGVSRSAVSRTFTPGASASSVTAEKVRMAAAKLGYKPNSLARAVVSGRSRIVGLVVAYLDNQFYPEALEKLSVALQEKGYHVLVFMASQAAGNIDSVVEEILAYQVEGLILASVALSSDVAERCRDVGVPVVLFNRSQDVGDVTAVTSANVAGGRKVADFLLAGGHRRIGYIAGWEGASTQRDREAGFVNRLTEAGVSLYAREVGQFTLDGAAGAAQRMFDRPDRPEAVFVANDHMAFAVMDVLRFQIGLTVPANVSVVGYDDVPLSGWPTYDLTTVRQPANRMVSETVDILLRQISHRESESKRLEIEGPLIVRGSARVPERWAG